MIKIIRAFKQAKDVSDAVRRIGATPDGKYVLDYLLKEHGLTIFFSPDPRVSAFEEGKRFLVMFLVNCAYGPDLATDALRKVIEKQKIEKEEE